MRREIKGLTPVTLRDAARILADAGKPVDGFILGPWNGRASSCQTLAGVDMNRSTFLDAYGQLWECCWKIEEAENEGPLTADDMGDCFKHPTLPTWKAVNENLKKKGITWSNSSS